MRSKDSRLPQANAALLLIDVINDLDFSDNEELLDGLPELAANLSRLKYAVRRAEIPVIYLNDNFNNWHSNFNEQLQLCTKRGANGRELAIALRPSGQDYFVLKPMHSGFFGTPLQILLGKLGVKTLILAGIAADICVLYTANDAYMRNYKLIVASDGVISNHKKLTDEALEKMRSLLKARIMTVDELVSKYAK
ncbi:MAG TPA: isochorismatase family cysteine hydrolase [Candidatus Melainabacteria bacterium]|nr:isochorismatase family cysteine hydrolase [Candidatus Melainabacteria bacterium]